MLKTCLAFLDSPRRAYVSLFPTVALSGCAGVGGLFPQWSRHLHLYQELKPSLLYQALHNYYLINLLTLLGERKKAKVKLYFFLVLCFKCFSWVGRIFKITLLWWQEFICLFFHKNKRLFIKMEVIHYKLRVSYSGHWTRVIGCVSSSRAGIHNERVLLADPTSSYLEDGEWATLGTAANTWKTPQIAEKP